jgi:hypothetical protein
MSAVQASPNQSSPSFALQLELVRQSYEREAHILQKAHLKGLLELEVGQLYLFHFKEKVEPPLRRDHLRLVQKYILYPLKVASPLVSLSRNPKLLIDRGLNNTLKVIIPRKILSQLKVSLPLFTLMKDNLTSLVDLLLVVVEDILFLMFGQIRFILFLEVLEHPVHFFSLQQKIILLVKGKGDFFDDTLAEVRVVGVEKATDSFVEHQQRLVEGVIVV